MRYRDLTSGRNFSKDIATLVHLVGEREYWELLCTLGKSLNMKGYVTETDDLRFSLERQLLNLELLRRKKSGKFNVLPSQLHEASDFIIGLGQTIPFLSPAAKKTLRGQIIGGLKTAGLRSVQHEMRVAAKLSNSGCEIKFADLEGIGSYDFLAEKANLTYEVEAKALSLFSGWPIKPQDADYFFLEIHRKFDGWQDKTQIPILNVTTNSSPPVNRAELLRLVTACNEVARSRMSRPHENYATIEFVGAIPVAANEQLAFTATVDQLAHGVYVFVKQRPPRVIVRLRTTGRFKLRHNVTATISDVAKRQFSKNRPGVIWTHIDYITSGLFDSLAISKTDHPSFFDSIANSIFRSPKRDHVIQLVFSGGTFLYERPPFQRSSYNITIYNSPTSEFNGPMPFSGGRTGRPLAPARPPVVPEP
jgi:hypothetical protein